MDKIYEITKISPFFMTVEAVETDLSIGDVPKSEVWDIGEFEQYKVRLINSGGKADIIDFEDWKEKHDLKK